MCKNGKHPPQTIMIWFLIFKCCLEKLFYVCWDNERRDSGLSWKILSRLPVSKCTEKQIGESCVVCLNEYDENSRCKRLPCMHCFHPKCIDTWLRKKPHCPLCHTNIREAMAKSESKAPNKKRWKVIHHPFFSWKIAFLYLSTVFIQKENHFEFLSFFFSLLLCLR